MEHEEYENHKEKVDKYIQEKAGLSLEEGYFLLIGLAKDYERTIFDAGEDFSQEEVEEVPEDDFDFVEDETQEEEDEPVEEEIEATPVKSKPQPPAKVVGKKAQPKKVNIISLLKKPVVVRNKFPKKPSNPEG